MAQHFDRLVLERVRAAVARLPAMTREVYWMSAVEGLDLDAIAQRLGLESDEVEAELAEAIVLLDRMLGEDGP